MAVNSKQKGSSNERAIAIRLSKRFEEYTGLSNSFRRNIDSGAFFGRTNQKRLETYDTSKATLGDIICPDNFKFSLECKFYKEPPHINSLITQYCKQWDEWIEQASQDSKNSNKEMAVIIKYNRVSEFVIIENKIDGICNIPYKTFFVVTLDDWLNQKESYFFV